MPISYKHKIYTTLGTPTVLSGDVVSTTNNAGVPTKDYTVKGKTIVWNQLFDKNSIPNRNSTAITYSVDGNINISYIIMYLRKDVLKWKTRVFL